MRLLVIVGPTAAGKSTLAEHLADRLPVELVSADASQVYRGLDVGTAKPTAAVQRRCRYHGIDLRAPTRRASAGAFGRWARRRLRAIHHRGNLPVLVGGSGFYVQATVWGLDRLPASRPAVRGGLQEWATRVGPSGAHAMLARLDPAWAGQLAINDAQRVLRALEVVLRTGRTRDQLAGRRGSGDDLAAADIRWVGLAWSRPTLYARIEKRVDEMLARGWVAEVEGLLSAGIDPGAHALQAIGYRQLVAYLRGESSLEQARHLIVDATRKYAKRQLTWTRRWLQVEWLHVEDDAQLRDCGETVSAGIESWCGC